jgi:hypothetical protein
MRIFCPSAVLFSYQLAIWPLISVVFCSFIGSVLVREAVLPRFRVVDKLVFSSKTAPFNAARVATEVAEIMRRVVVNIPLVLHKVTSADVPLFAAGPLTDIRALSCGRTKCIARDFMSCLGLWLVLKLLRIDTRPG